jgi:ElaB/YqjD/DUF883 family membrane-anchored ribosome-binding protein
MTSTNETLNRTAGHAADVGEEIGESASEFASDVSRKAGKQFARAKNMTTDVYEEAHEASKDYPHVTLALAAGLGFLLGVLATRR